MLQSEHVLLSSRGFVAGRGLHCPLWVLACAEETEEFDLHVCVCFVPL